MAPGIEWEPLMLEDWILVERYFSLLYQWINMNYFVISSIVYLLLCGRVSFRVLEIKKTNRNCLIITLFRYIYFVIYSKCFTCRFSCKVLLSYFTLSLSSYSMRLSFLFSMSHEGIGIIHFFFFFTDIWEIGKRSWITIKVYLYQLVRRTNK